MKYVCEWCGCPFDAAPSSKRKFCGADCSLKHKSKKYNPIGYLRKPHLSELNRKLNPTRMTEDVRTKLCLLRLGSGNKKSYKKLNGRHLHRAVAEAVLGRALEKGEVIHHIDGNKQNNNPDNLMLFRSQKEHASWHGRVKKNGV